METGLAPLQKPIPTVFLISALGNRNNRQPIGSKENEKHSWIGGFAIQPIACKAALIQGILASQAAVYFESFFFLWKKKSHE